MTETAVAYGGSGRLRNDAGRGALWSLVSQWAIRASGLLTFVILARLLTPNDFGAIALASTLALVLSFLAGAGLTTYLVHDANPDQGTLSTAFWLNAGAGLLLAVAMAGLSWPLSRLLEAPTAAPVLAAVSLSVLLPSLKGVPTAVLRRRFEFRRLSLQVLVATVLGQLVAVVMAFAGAGVWSLVGQVWVVNAVSLGMAWRAARWTPSWQYSWARAWTMVRYGVHVVGVVLIGNLADWVVNGLISRGLGVAQVGYYTMAHRITVMAADSVGYASREFGVALFASVQHDRARFRNAVFAAQAAVTAVVTPLLAGLIINAGLVVPAILGEKWAPTVPALQFLAAAGIVQVLGWTICHPALLAIGRPDLSMYTTAAASVVLMALAVPAAQASITAVAAVNALAWSLLAPVMLGLTSQVLGVRLRRTLWEVSRIVGISAVAGLPALLVTLRLADLAPDLIVAGASMAVYAAVQLALVRWLAADVWENIIGMMRSVTRRRARANRMGDGETSHAGRGSCDR